MYGYKDLFHEELTAFLAGWPGETPQGDHCSTERRPHVQPRAGWLRRDSFGSGFTALLISGLWFHKIAPLNSLALGHKQVGVASFRRSAMPINTQCPHCEK